ncbi:sugar ABC transporter permease [Clostridium thermosuccinogenes]|jgi:putative aldouronate transport system permease protein|uniref:Sugar ABC transporter permease n=2 Tax=Clostridium thermosuccinogenes TaxID=84032 RepID=A0A2K2FII3_9CLOT|nr:sugar ABC transporter permease [Pseudoclostridium thermosuccinogenes]PNT91575.1 sugar ABC transporter permease [Pseudoclostridium thermosuccinogenes]PNT96755.1 sugar ABC transporter permease [Pseudoclostridium thermosuccinogenes]PNT98592.1 sugar ABC transporter permease [Pseudoclostridium thermosuccinogenes]
MNGMSKLNRIKPLTNYMFNLLFVILSLISILPVVLVFMASISSETSIAKYGYQFWPEEFSFVAYSFLWNERASIFQALFVSVCVTVVGTALGVLLTTTMGYVLSRLNFRGNGFYTWVVFIPMIFNGGMAANYVVVSKFLHLNNTIWALILPLCVSSFNVIVCKTFFRTTIPDSIIESVKIDGGGQLTIFLRIVMPISKPLIATIALFLSFGYWNDWFQSSLYISNKALLSLQAMLNNIQKNIEYIANNPSAGVSLQQYKNSMPTEPVRMAIAIVIVVPIACVYPFFQRFFIKGLTIGAIKG